MRSESNDEVKRLEATLQQAEKRMARLSAEASHGAGALGREERVSQLRARHMEVAVKLQAFRESEAAMRDRMREALTRAIDELGTQLGEAESA